MISTARLACPGLAVNSMIWQNIVELLSETGEAGPTTAALAIPVRRGRAAIILSAVRCARAMMVIMGLAPREVGHALASPIHTPFTSYNSPLVLATLMEGSLPIRQVHS